MRARWIKPFALAALLTGAGLVFGQAGPGDTKKDADPKAEQKQPGDKAGKDAVNAFAEGDEQRMMLLGLKRFTKVESFNSKAARRRIADRLINDNKYPL